jgi:hypothetical protein
MNRSCDLNFKKKYNYRKQNVNFNSYGDWKMKKLYLILFVITIINALFFYPTEIKAEKKVTYMAGNFQPGTFICHCPVVKGDCMCAVHD